MGSWVGMLQENQMSKTTNEKQGLKRGHKFYLKIGILYIQKPQSRALFFSMG